MKVPNVWTENASLNLLEALRYWGVRSSPAQHAYRPGDDHYASSKFQEDDVVIVEVKIVKTKSGDEAFYISDYMRKLGQNSDFLDIVFVTQDAVVLNNVVLNTPQGEFIVLSRDADVPFYDWLKENFDKGTPLDVECTSKVDFDDDIDWEDVYRDFIHNMADNGKSMVVQANCNKDESKVSGILSTGNIRVRAGECTFNLSNPCSEVVKPSSEDKEYVWELDSRYQHNEFQELYKLQAMIAQKV